MARLSSRLIGASLPAAAAVANSFGAEERSGPLCDSMPHTRSGPGAPSTAEYGEARLLQVQVVFRHGARTPLTANFWKGQQWDCCGQPYEPAPVEISHKSGGPRPGNRQNDKQIGTILEGGCHKGELTILGKQQALELGQTIRRRYCQELHFLPETFQEGLISAHTTNIARTVQTLTGVVSGLYSDVPKKRPLQVSTLGEAEEFMFANPRSCPQLKLLLQASRRQVTESFASNETFQRLTDEIVLRSGGDLQPPFNFIDMYDAFTSMKAHGKDLPSWADVEILHQIEQIATERITTIFKSGTDVLHLTMARLLQELVGNIQACLSGSSKEKLHLYSGHDTTVLPLLSAFGMELDHWPPYASNVMLELWECTCDGKKEHYVRAIYNGQEVCWPGLRPGQMCRLDQLKEYVLHRFLDHNPDIHCVVPDKAATASKAPTPETGSQF